MGDSLRVALISEHASPLAALGGVDAGGQNIYVAHVARCLARRGHQVDVLTRRDDATQLPVVKVRPGLRVLHVPAGPPRFVAKERLLAHMPAFAELSTRLLGNSGPYDVVHANFFMSGWVAQQLRQRLHIPYAITFHALGLVRREHQKEADTFSPERIDIERRLVREADAVIAECPQDRTDLIRLYGAPANRLAMVPCGFDPAEFAPCSRAQARERLGLDPNEYIVLQLGRLVPRKGIDNVIRALAHLPPSMNVRLLVVGGESAEPDERRTPEMARLRQVAREAGVQARVTFTGQRQRHELKHCYAAANVFVTTPWYEPFGITPLEAMACGTPVIASAVGGLQYSVDDGMTGFLVPPHDPPALARRIALLHDNPALAATLGRAGMRRARALFTWERVTDELVQVYQAVRQPQALAIKPPAWRSARQHSDSRALT